MKMNKSTLGLAAVGLVSLAPGLRAQNNAPAAIPLTTALSATTISGYVDTSMVWNPGTGNANPAPSSFNAGKQDGFNLDSVDLKIARALDATDWSAGYTLELQYGADAFTPDGPIRQAYIELSAPVGNGLNFEVGQFDNILGYESKDDYKNPNWSRSYGFTINPSSQVGVLATYKFSDAFSAQAGVANELNPAPGNNARNTDGHGGSAIESKKALVSLISLTAPDSWGALAKSVLYAGLDYGPGNALNIAKTHNVDKTDLYIGATINTPVKDLTLGVAWDTVNNSDLGAVEGYAGTLGLYASYKLTDKASINGRAEYAHGSAFDTLLGEAAVIKEQDAKVFALTGTLQYDLWANVISRVEARWDASADGSPHFGGIGTPGTGVAATKHNDLTLAANLIYRF